MKKYRCYIPVVLILLLFFSLFFFRGNLIRYASRNMTAGMETTEKSTVESTLSEQYDYSKNKKSYDYTFLEFGSIGCHSCRQMEYVMEEIKQKYSNRVNVVFVNVNRKENKDLVDYFGIVTIPAQVLLDKNGKKYFRHNGYLSADDLSKHFK
ncbi:thioredoxin family protein [Bacteroides thetaiotaomicron]|uniref:thioredoxin family protein n=1 Tax=Bacteroides thetaiotaomicron TaxID=818 RepID=UPI0039C456B6